MFITTQPATQHALAAAVLANPTWLVELFAETTGGPNVLRGRGSAIASALAGNDVPDPTFDVDSIRKDLLTMLAEGKVHGVDLPLVTQTLAVYDEASAAGWGARDGTTLTSYWPARNPN